MVEMARNLGAKLAAILSLVFSFLFCSNGVPVFHGIWLKFNTPLCKLHLGEWRQYRHVLEHNLCSQACLDSDPDSMCSCQLFCVSFTLAPKMGVKCA